MDWIELSACNRGHTKDSANPRVLIIVEEELAYAAELIRQDTCGGGTRDFNEQVSLMRNGKPQLL